MTYYPQEACFLGKSQTNGLITKLPSPENFHNRHLLAPSSARRRTQGPTLPSYSPSPVSRPNPIKDKSRNEYFGTLGTPRQLRNQSLQPLKQDIPIFTALPPTARPYLLNSYDSDPFNMNSMDWLRTEMRNLFRAPINHLSDRIFIKYDQNRSGFLDRKEIYPAVCELYLSSSIPPPSYQTVLTIMAKYDSDHNGLIDPLEFRRLCAELNGF